MDLVLVGSFFLKNFYENESAILDWKYADECLKNIMHTWGISWKLNLNNLSTHTFKTRQMAIIQLRLLTSHSTDCFFFFFFRRKRKKKKFEKTCIHLLPRSIHVSISSIRDEDWNWWVKSYEKNKKVRIIILAIIQSHPHKS